MSDPVLNVTSAVASLELSPAPVDTAQIQGMLLNQAQAMQNLSARLLQMAQDNPIHNYSVNYVGLALKALAQARATLQTLGEISAPRQGVVIEQPSVTDRDDDRNAAA
jgi:hypothetical protein